MEISLKTPGKVTPLPNYVLDDLRNLHPRYKKYISFFGGHPVSITKQTSNSIFTDVSQNADGALQSQYLVCQKTDGVRYLMIICHVLPEDVIQHQNLNSNGHRHEQKFSPVQCYLISRQGQQKLVAYATNLNIGKGWSKRKQGNFKHVIQILDGQLIVDQNVGQTKQVFKYLIFDMLVHLGQNITKIPLLLRLKQIKKFIQCNSFLLQNVPKQQQRQKINIEMKDFFRLNSEKYNIVKFLLQKYIKCLPHENDGLIFNHQSKQYQFGVNPGYIKWKPAHLNTLDFMLVPNTHLSQRFGNRVLDMYLATKDLEVEGNYVRSFYAFTVVSQKEFEDIEDLNRINKDKIFQQKYENQEDTGDKGHFQGSVISECKFQETNTEQRGIFRQLFDIKKDPSEIYQYVMKPFNQKSQLSRIQSLQKAIYDRCWKIYKVRDDKGLPNNTNVAERIEQSIKDNILQDELIKKNDQLNQKCKAKY